MFDKLLYCMKTKQNNYVNVNQYLIGSQISSRWALGCWNQPITHTTAKFGYGEA